MAKAKAWVIIPKSVNKGTECVLEMLPLVLCKDCKHFKRIPRESVYDCHEYYCHNLLDYVPSPDWFCPNGEVKEDA